MGFAILLVVGIAIIVFAAWFPPVDNGCIGNTPHKWEETFSGHVCTKCGEHIYNDDYTGNGGL